MLLLATFFGIGAWHIITSPVERIDVWHLQQRGSQLLLSGVNPYSAEYPISATDENLYGPAVLKNGQVQSYPYPPLSLLTVTPGYLVGDIRWMLLAALLGTAVLLRAIGRAFGSEQCQTAELAAVAFLCQPLTLHILERGWTEPLVALAVSFCLWTMTARRTLLAGIALGMTISIKQYGILWLLPMLASGRLTWRKLVGGALVTFTVNVPFLLWNPVGFWRGLVVFHTDSPFRAESLTIPAAMLAQTGWQPPSWIALAAALAVGAFLILRSGPTLTQMVLGGAAVFLVLFLFSKAGHLNYYWFAAALLIMAVAPSCQESGQPS